MVAATSDLNDWLGAGLENDMKLIELEKCLTEARKHGAVDATVIMVSISYGECDEIITASECYASMEPPAENRSDYGCIWINDKNAEMCENEIKLHP